MQQVKLHFLDKYQFVSDIIRVFETYSDLENAIDTYRISASAKPLIDLLDKQFNNTKHFWNFYERKVVKPSEPTQPNKAIICFSGGKDSVNVALQLKDKYDLTLYFLQGVNISYPNELQHAKECAEKLGLPLVVEECKIKGHTTFLENPVKNPLIFACALNYGLPKGITTYFFGNANDESIENSNPDRDFSDSKEMFELFRQWVSKDMGVEIINKPIIESGVESIINVGKDIELRALVQSCLTPHRFQRMRHDYNVNKYNVRLPQNLCGGCWKCCVSYIIWADLGLIAYNKDFYIHCLDFLKSKSLAERGKKTNDYKETYIAFINEELYEQSILRKEHL